MVCLKTLFAGKLCETNEKCNVFKYKNVVIWTFISIPIHISFYHCDTRTANRIHFNKNNNYNVNCPSNYKLHKKTKQNNNTCRFDGYLCLCHMYKHTWIHIVRKSINKTKINKNDLSGKMTLEHSIREIDF